MRWSVIKVCQGLVEASIIKGLLESNNIPVKLEYETVGALLGLSLDGLGEVKVLVPQEYVDLAKNIIGEKDGVET